MNDITTKVWELKREFMRDISFILNQNPNEEQMKFIENELLNLAYWLKTTVEQ